MIFAPAVNASGSPYAGFAFLASDGEMDSAPAQATIDIAGLVPPVPGSITCDTTNGFQMFFSGDSNTVYCAWGSTNLSTWQFLGPGTQLEPGTFLFTNLEATNMTQRFYRLSTD